MSKNVLIVAGEASGDMHAAELVRATCEISSDIKFTGIGGGAMREAGVNVLFDSAKIAVVGFVEVIAHYTQIKKAWNIITAEIERQKPDLLILVDYPGFNLKLAKFAKKHGVKVLYYISPQVWAWKKGRVKTMTKCIDMMAVIFPFEVPIYEKENIPVKFVGHPLTKQTKPILSKEEAYDLFSVENEKRIITLLPGSRKGEIKRMLPTMIKTAEKLTQQHNNLEFLIPLAPSLSLNDLLPYLKKPKVNINIVSHEHFSELIHMSDAVITASGTATLQTALINTPMVIIYKMSWLSYLLARFFLRIPHFGLCNVVAGKKVVKELAQHHANPDAIFSEVNAILTKSDYEKGIRSELAKIKTLLETDFQENLSQLVVAEVSGA